MVTIENVSLESINKKLDSMLENQELIKMFIKMKAGRKIKGDELKEHVRILTQNGYSVKEISNILNCSTSAVSYKRREIKAESNEDIDEYIDF